MLLRFFHLLVLGPEHTDTLRPQGLSRGKELVLEEWRRPSFGVLRLTRLFLISVALLFPAIYIIDDFTRSTKAAVLGTAREAYYIGRGIFVVIALVTPLHQYGIVAGVVAYFVFEILFHLAGGALVWGKYSINPQRSLVLALINYFEVTVAFAVFYIYFNCISWDCPSATQALYFSFETATTVGFGDLTPVGSTGQKLVMAQLIVFAAFVLLFLTIFISRIPTENRE